MSRIEVLLSAESEYDRLSELCQTSDSAHRAHYKNGAWFGYKLALAEEWWNAFLESKHKENK